MQNRRRKPKQALSARRTLDEDIWAMRAPISLPRGSSRPARDADLHSRCMLLCPCFVDCCRLVRIHALMGMLEPLVTLELLLLLLLKMKLLVVVSKLFMRLLLLAVVSKLFMQLVFLLLLPLLLPVVWPVLVMLWLLLFPFLPFFVSPSLHRPLLVLLLLLISLRRGACPLGIDAFQYAFHNCCSRKQMVREGERRR